MRAILPMIQPIQAVSLAGQVSNSVQQGAQLKGAAVVNAGELATVNIGSGNIGSANISSANNGLAAPSTVQVPGPPQSVDGRSQPAGGRLAAPARRLASPTDCVVDFTDQAMLQFSELSLWGRSNPCAVVPRLQRRRLCVFARHCAWTLSPELCRSYGGILFYPPASLPEPSRPGRHLSLR